jgi:hypothetical protein
METGVEKVTRLKTHIFALTLGVLFGCTQEPYTNEQEKMISVYRVDRVLELIELPDPSLFSLQNEGPELVEKFFIGLQGRNRWKTILRFSGEYDLSFSLPFTALCRKQF